MSRVSNNGSPASLRRVEGNGQLILFSSGDGEVNISDLNLGYGRAVGDEKSWNAVKSCQESCWKGWHFTRTPVLSCGIIPSELTYQGTKLHAEKAPDLLRMR